MYIYKCSECNLKKKEKKLKKDINKRDKERYVYTFKLKRMNFMTYNICVKNKTFSKYDQFRNIFFLS